MNNRLRNLANSWGWKDKKDLVNEIEIQTFEFTNNLIIPKDLGDYFKQINGTDGYDDGFFQFYSLENFKSIVNQFITWKTVFDSKKFSEAFGSIDSCFVFADYQIHLFSYAIQLNRNETEKNQVFVFCDNDFKLIADSFTEFIELCLEDSHKLFFND